MDNKEFDRGKESDKEYILRKLPFEARRASDAKEPNPILVPHDTSLEVNFRPPEEYFRLGIRYDSRENYQKFGYIALDERYILRNDGEVYVLIDEDSLNINSNDVKNFEEHQRKEHYSMDTRISDLEALLKIILEGGLSPSTQIRLIRWWVCGRFGIDLERI